MPQMKLNDQIKDIIKSCHDYEITLTHLMRSLNEQLSYVNINASKATEEVDNHFDRLQESVISMISWKRKELLSKILNSKSETSETLIQCKKSIEEKLTNTSIIQEECNHLQRSNLDKVSHDVKLSALNKMSSTIGSIPEIPALHNVPRIKTHSESSCANDVTHLIKKSCQVTCDSPVQICSWTQYPGSVNLKWQEVNDDEIDDPKFCIRYCEGDLTKDENCKKFVEIPTGVNTYFTIRNLKDNILHSFQVAYFTQKPKNYIEKLWSSPLVLLSSVPHYKFLENNANFLLEKNCKVASKITDTSSLKDSILSSCVSSKCQCHSMSFRVLDVGNLDGDDSQGIGIIQGHGAYHSWLKESSLVYSFEGKIFLNGKEMLTKMPKLLKNSSVIINSNIVKSGEIFKFRVCIVSEDKQVIFDWKISDMELFKTAGSSGEFSLNFAICFFNSGWKIQVS